MWPGNNQNKGSKSKHQVLETLEYFVICFLFHSEFLFSVQFTLVSFFFYIYFFSLVFIHFSFGCILFNFYRIYLHPGICLRHNLGNLNDYYNKSNSLSRR